MPIELPVLTVSDAAAWSDWLGRSAATSKGVWLTLAKKGTISPTSLTYGQALDEALCQGWIDGQARGGDEHTYAQRFTPRAPKSLWSRRNVDHIARLEQEGRVTALGRAAVAAAKADGRWDAAYAGQATAEPPPEFLVAVAAVPKAQAMWDVLTRQNRFAIYFRLNALKTPAGREKRIAAFVDMLARGETLHPQKQQPAVTGMTILKAASKKTNLKTASQKATSKTSSLRARVQRRSTLRTGESLRRSGRLSKLTESPP
ncbi:hypothetical protein F5Y19DRAFT_152105 [Xylariaceae sp. FL1651]|nr:hypothetical protein F5Y19DRAFT_152105 [Xylariaceae sp. FL1651]